MLVWQVERRVQVHRREGVGFTVVDYGAADTLTLSGRVHISVQDFYP